MKVKFPMLVKLGGTSINGNTYAREPQLKAMREYMKNYSMLWAYNPTKYGHPIPTSTADILTNDPMDYLGYIHEYDEEEGIITVDLLDTRYEAIKDHLDEYYVMAKMLAHPSEYSSKIFIIDKITGLDLCNDPVNIRKEK